VPIIVSSQRSAPQSIAISSVVSSQSSSARLQSSSAPGLMLISSSSQSVPMQPPPRPKPSASSSTQHVVPTGAHTVIMPPVERLLMQSKPRGQSGMSGSQSCRHTFVPSVRRAQRAATPHCTSRMHSPQRSTRSSGPVSAGGSGTSPVKGASRRASRGPDVTPGAFARALGTASDRGRDEERDEHGAEDGTTHETSKTSPGLATRCLWGRARGASPVGRQIPPLFKRVPAKCIDESGFVDATRRCAAPCDLPTARAGRDESEDTWRTRCELAR
jgi:hypothetical protein